MPPTRSRFPTLIRTFLLNWSELCRKSGFLKKNCQNNTLYWLLLAPFERVSQCQFQDESPGESGLFYLVRILEENCLGLVRIFEEIGGDLFWIFILLVWNLDWRQ